MWYSFTSLSIMIDDRVRHCFFTFYSATFSLCNGGRWYFVSFYIFSVRAIVHFYYSTMSSTKLKSLFWAKMIRRSLYFLEVTIGEIGSWVPETWDVEKQPNDGKTHKWFLMQVNSYRQNRSREIEHSSTIPIVLARHSRSGVRALIYALGVEEELSPII